MSRKSSKSKIERWSVFFIGKKAELITTIEASSEKQAVERAGVELEIPEASRFRLTARRSV